jgi:cytochrome c-type biogenesis protein CcsB
MAELSRELLFGAILAYLVAMMCYAAEFVIGVNAPAEARAAAMWGRARRRELVGAGGPGDLITEDGSDTGSGMSSAESAPDIPETSDMGQGTADGVSGRDRDRAAGWMPLLARAAVAVTAIGVLLHLGGLVTRGIAADRVPWGNMYEFIIAVTLVGAVGWLGLVIARPAVRPLGLFVALVLVLLLGLDLIVLRTAVEPLMPALNSYWLKIHVTLAITASGVFMLGFCVAVLHLVRAGYEKRVEEDRPIGFPFTLGERLPAAAALERLTFRVHAFGFPIWTLAITCGAIWAEAAWSRYWGWDPKETWSFIAWVVYASYLHARATPSVRRTAATWFAVAGWTMMMVNLFVVNFLVSGLHSYAGVK